MIDNRYRIIKKLGAGGMGEVYKVMDIHTGAQLALKKSSFKHTRNEFLALSKLYHPNIVKVFEFGNIIPNEAQKTHPEYFFTMEYIDGVNLYDIFKDSLPKTRDELDKLNSIISQICDALRLIHFHKLVHCDIKPSNILIQFVTSKEPRAVLTDFGLIEKGASKKLKGTLQYIAPEILKGEKMDRSADLFSLGVTIYYVITNRLPFKGDNAISLINQHNKGKVTPPKELNPSIPEELNELVLSLLLPKSRRRIDSVEDVQKTIHSISGKIHKTKVFTPVLVGREKELSTLKNTLEEVKSSKKGRVIEVWGKNGVGKTRLLKEFVPYALTEGTRVKYFDSRKDIVGVYAKNMEKEIPEGSELNLFAKIQEKLSKESTSLPLLLIVEDLQVSKRTNLKFLEYLIRSIENENIILIITSSDEKVNFSSTQSPNYLSKILLKPLSYRDTKNLLKSMLLTNNKIGEIGELIQDYTAGNPFLLTTLVPNLVENGIIHKKNGKWKISKERLRTLHLPKDIKHFTTSLLSGLSKEEFNLLKIGALLKDEFNLKMLKDLTPLKPSVMLALQKKGIIVENSPGYYSFTHQMVSNIIYQNMDAEERRLIHAKIARLLERRFKDDPYRIAPSLTHHYLKAGEKEKAYEFALLSGERAENTSANTEAAEYFELALSLADDTKKGEIQDIYETLGHLYRIQGRFEDALMKYESALSLASRDSSVRIYRNIGMIHRDQRNYREALEYFKRGYEINFKDHSQKILLLSDMGWADIGLGDLEKAKSSTRKAIRMAKNYNDQFGLAYGLSTLGSVYIQSGDYERAGQYYKKGLKIAQEIKNGELIRSTSYNLGQILWKTGKPNQARRLYRKSLKTAGKNGNLSRVAMYNKALGILAQEQGDFVDAEKHYTSATDIFKKIGDDRSLASLYLALGHMYQDLSDIENALRYYKIALSTSQRIKDEPLIARIYSNLGNLYQEEGNLAEALKSLKEALKIKKRTADGSDIAFPLHNIGYVYMLSGDLNEASKFLHESFELSKKQNLKKAMAEVCSSLGEYYLRTDNLKDAEYYCLEGIKACEEINDKMNLGITNRVLGIVYTKKGEIDKALGVFSKSMEILEELKADYELAKSFIVFGEQMFSIREKIGRKFWQEGLLEKTIKGIKKAEGIFKKLNAARDLRRANSLISKFEDFSPIFLEPVPGEDKKLKTLYRMSQIINSTMDINELLEKILDLTIEVMGAERGLILLREGEELKVKTARKMDKHSIADMSSFSRTIVENVEKKGELIITANAQKEPRFKEKQSIAEFKLLSILCVPFKIKDRVVGAVYIDDRRRKDAFTSDDLEFLRAFCDQAAIALENAMLIEELKTANKLLEFENITMKDQISHLKTTVEDRYSFGKLIGKSKPMQQVYSALEKIIGVDSAVIIEGETGTGKELIADIIHYNGPRKDKNFIVVNSSAIPENLLESELFGHVKGAFTGATNDKQGLFELADGGTIFLDEISELNPDLQAKLLRVLQDGELRRVGSTKVKNVNVRIMAATNKDLKNQIDQGKFREDLFYRLNVMSILVPPLRDRKEDIPILALHILHKFRKKTHKNVTGFTPEALYLINNYHWPGNVRELENIIERAIVMTEGKKITDQDLPKSLIQEIPDKTKEPLLPISLAETEKRAIIAVLKATGGNKLKAVKILGITRPTLDKKMQKYSL